MHVEDKAGRCRRNSDQNEFYRCGLGKYLIGKTLEVLCKPLSQLRRKVMKIVNDYQPLLFVFFPAVLAIKNVCNGFSGLLSGGRKVSIFTAVLELELTKNPKNQ